MDKTDDNKRYCKAACAGSGERCRKLALAGKDYCAIHDKRGNAKPESKPKPALEKGSWPSRREVALLDRIVEMRDDPNLLTLRTEVATLKAMLEEALQRLDEARSTGERDGAAPVEKRVESLTMSILSAGEKFARIEERRRGVLTANEIGVLIDRIKERVIEVVRTSEKDNSPEETAQRIAEAFSTIEIVGGGD